MYKAMVILVALIIFCGYMYFSKPDTVVVNEKGKIDGLANKGRELFQGDKFWKLQLKLANDMYDKSIAPQIPSSFEMQKLYSKLAEDERALNEKMKSLYTPEEQMANSLRMKADSLERAGKWRLIDQAAVEENTKETEKLKIIIAIIEANLRGAKPQDLKAQDKPAV